MKKSLKVTALAVSMFALTPAFAQEGMYVGVNVSQTEYKEEGIPSAKPSAISFKVGNQFNKNFALEARLGTGLSDDRITVFGVPATVEVDNFYGVYAKGILPVSNMISAYGLVGYTHGEITARAAGMSVTGSDSDFSYGLGVDFAITQNMSLNIEWARLFEGAGYKVNALSFGVGYKF